MNNSTELSDAAKKARAEYTRKYRKEHPEKVRQWNKNFWERKAAEQATGSESTESDVSCCGKCKDQI